MTLLIGWSLLIAIVGGIWLLVRMTGSEAGTPDATCGKGACGKAGAGLDGR